MASEIRPFNNARNVIFQLCMAGVYPTDGLLAFYSL